MIGSCCDDDEAADDGAALVTADAGVEAALDAVGAQLLVRGWLSANNIVFAGDRGASPVVVDTGYVSHAAQTTALVRHALGGRRLERIVNTHLHSDHCGGNDALRAEHPGAVIATPIGTRDAVHPWNEDRLTYRFTGQHCPQFPVDAFIAPGDEILLGPRQWQVHAAGGHDPDAVMFFEPQSRTLISGDALWEKRLAIIFPALAGGDGFEAAYNTLKCIQRLDARCVLPGHGGAFTNVAAALTQSFNRLHAFARAPQRHRQHAARALAMFHMLEHRQVPRSALEVWMANTPVFQSALTSGAEELGRAELLAAAIDTVQSLLVDGVLKTANNDVVLPA